jgi:hypothetical protein
MGSMAAPIDRSTTQPQTTFGFVTFFPIMSLTQKIVPTEGFGLMDTMQNLHFKMQGILERLISRLSF